MMTLQLPERCYCADVVCKPVLETFNFAIENILSFAIRLPVAVLEKKLNNEIWLNSTIY